MAKIVVILLHIFATLLKVMSQRVILFKITNNFFPLIFDTLSICIDSWIKDFVRVRAGTQVCVLK